MNEVKLLYLNTLHRLIYLVLILQDFRSSRQTVLGSKTHII